MEVSLLSNVYCKIISKSRTLRMHSIQPIWWDVEKLIQSNLISYADIWFIYMRYNPFDGSVTYEWTLHTEIRNLSCGEFRIAFLYIPRIMVHGRYYYSHFLFFYFFLGFSLFVCCCCFVSLFWRPKRSMQLGNINFPFLF